MTSAFKDVRAVMEGENKVVLGDTCQQSRDEGGAIGRIILAHNNEDPSGKRCPNKFTNTTWP